MMNWKKVISITLCFILLFSIVIPPKKSEAFVPAFAIPLSAIPASVKISAGAMALGGTIVAGILTGLALDAIDFDIVGRAQEIWDGFSSMLKNAWENLFDSHWGSDTNNIPIDQSLKSGLVTDLPVAYLRGNAGMSVKEVERRYFSNELWFRAVQFHYPKEEDYYFIAFYDDKYGLFRYFTVGWRVSNQRIRYDVGTQVGGHNIPLYGYVSSLMSQDGWKEFSENVLVSVRATLGWLNLSEYTGPTVSVVPGYVVEEFNRMREDIYSSAFPLVSANEIYYPLNDIYPYAEDLGKDYPLEWNSDLEAFVLPQNPSVPYNGNIGWYIPAPTTYVDVNDNVRVGFPSADGTITDALTGQKVGTGAGAEPIPGDGVDVPSGFFDAVLQGISSLVAGIGNIANSVSSLVGVFTTGLVGDVSAIQWQKLRDVGYDLTVKFPFSIPWDIGRAFDAIFGGISGTGPPVWEYKLDFLGRQYAFAISIPDYLMNWFPILRSFILVLFDVGIILSIRQWLGGAS